MKDKVTVGIPVYNGEKYIQKALQSVADQTHKVDEILICDNKSTDSTVEIIERFNDDNPDVNIRLIKNEVNIGADPNFNKCMELCDSKFLVLLGSDDRLKTDAIEKQISLFSKMPELGLVGGLFQSIDKDGNKKTAPPKKETIIFERGDILEFVKHTVFYIQHSTVMFNMDCTRKVGFFDVRYIANDERLYVTHLLEFPIAQIGDVLAEARFHAGQETRDENIRFKAKLLHFKSNLSMAEFESSPERILETKKILKKWIANQCSLLGRRVTRGQRKPITLIYVSPAYEGIWGRTCQSLYDEPKSFLEGIHPEDRDRVLEELPNQPEGNYDIQYRVTRPDGSIRWIHDRAFPIFNERGEVYRVCGLADDITDFKEAVEGQRRLEEQLRQAQKMEAIGTLAGGIAHDFNNMLAGILGNTDLQKIYAVKDSNIYQSALSIERAAQRAAHLTKQLLDFARKSAPQHELVNIHDTLHEVIDLIQPTMTNRIRISSQLNLDNPYIDGDPAQIQQVILNLLVNARDAITRDGEIQIDDSFEEIKPEDSQFEIPVRPGKYIKIGIRDNGGGIPEKIRERIFEPFFTTKPPGKGTGMGLALVYGIVKVHGGFIKIENQPQGGTCVELFLPQSKNKSRKSSDYASDVQVPVEMVRGKGKILVIDDEQLVREIATQLLKQLGYQVVTIGNGREAIAYYQNNANEIDLVLLDLVMPNVDGWECFQKMRAINPSIKAILTTGYSQSRVPEDYQEEGMCGFIPKPFQIQQLSELIAKALQY